MNLSEKAIEDFKKIYQKKFNIQLTDDVANRLGIELLNFVKLIYKPNLNGKYHGKQQT